MSRRWRGSGAKHTQVAVHGGRVHDVFEIEAFAVAAGERGRGYGQALLAALLLALAAAAPRPVVVVTLPRPQTEGFWKTTLLEWSRGSEGERGVWRALVAEDGAVEFAYPQDAATTLFWSETADRALRAVSPWFERLAARKAEVTPDQRVADLEAALATVEAERERLAKRIRVLEARRPPAASPVPPSDEDEAGAAPAAIARHLPPVATWPARSPRPEADDDAAGPAAAAPPPDDDAAAPVPAPPPPPDTAPAPAPADGRKQAENADDTDDDAPPPALRPVKREKRKTAHGYDCTDGSCVDGDEDEPARRARTSTEDIFGEPDSDEGDQDDAAEQPAKRRKEPPGWATVSM